MADNSKQTAWMDIKNTEIEAGDLVTFETESDNDAFDDTVRMEAEDTWSNNNWLLIETNGDDVVVLSPATGEDHPAKLVHGDAIRATGKIIHAERIAWVDGIESVEEGGD